jgi:hypothetical protein
MCSVDTSSARRIATIGRWSRGFAVVLLVFGLFVSLSVTPCVAGQGTDITKVDEYWELDLNTPNSANSAPQLTFLISPTGTTDSVYGIFVVNQRDGAVGGLQLQLWNGATRLATSTFSDVSSLATTGEKIQWITEMTVNNGTLTIAIKNLSSNTWGNYGTNQTVLTASTATSLSNFNAYDLNVSAANSGVDFGNTRVGKLILKKVVTVTGNQKSTDQLSSAKVIFQYP